MKSMNSNWSVIRKHTRKHTHKVVYEHYDSQEHAIYYTYITKSNVIDGFILHPDTTLKQYLKNTNHNRYL